jgi:hypothetical protein
MPQKHLRDFAGASRSVKLALPHCQAGTGFLPTVGARTGEWKTYENSEKSGSYVQAHMNRG